MCAPECVLCVCFAFNLTFMLSDVIFIISLFKWNEMSSGLMLKIMIIGTDRPVHKNINYEWFMWVTTSYLLQN